MAKIYLAGGVFSAAERLHNLTLEQHLKMLGHEVVLPQREALRFLRGETFDLAGVVADCQKTATHPEIVFVGCLDGTDADSGMAIEYGMRIQAVGWAILYRTDFRTAPEKEVGVNGMFHAEKTIYLYKPCYIQDFDDAGVFYQELAAAIDGAIRSHRA